MQPLVAILRRGVQPRLHGPCPCVYRVFPVPGHWVPGLRVQIWHREQALRGLAGFASRRSVEVTSRTELASLVLSSLTLWGHLRNPAPWREGRRELAPLDGSEGHRAPYRSHLEGSLKSHRVGRSVGRQCRATGITRMRQGRDMCSTPAARLRPTV